ncbi:MAG TPA: S8/S53 family peptidase [Bacteroidia bacterium]|jgi:subtilisin family serine protease|nr:S8/S53 family peptidase [Bacteroidia bacterium]
MKKILSLLITAFITGTTFGQSVTKMDYFLATKQEAYTAKKAEAKVMLPMLIEGNINTIKQLVKENGGTFKYSYGNIAAIIIPVSALPEFSANSGIIRMEGAPHHFVPCNDTMRKRNSIVAVQQGKFPLSQAYTGKGVVMGFIDTGIDYRHPDFIDPSGHSRVKFYWDQNQPIGVYTPLPYGYGQAWTGAEIDADLANDTAAYDDFGHGSNVAGAAVSNGRANGQEIGGCPDADIIFVALNFNSSSPTILTDAVNYIYTTAASLNEPCVINASLGDYNGSHDGLDLQALMIDTMIMAKQPGRYFIAAAGNAGTIPFHLHDSIPTLADSTCTWFPYDAGNRNVDIQLFADVADFNNVDFAIECDKVSTGSYSKRARSAFANISSVGAPTYLKNAAGDTLAKIQYYAQTYYPGNYSLEIVITTDSNSSAYKWLLVTKGQGRFDSWDLYSAADIVDTTGLMLSQTTFPEMKHYVMPDVHQTMCSSFQCSPQVITVANYTNRRCWYDYADTVYCGIITSPPGAIVPNSSAGPTRNYRLMKPDIAGAGNQTMSALPTAWKSAYIAGSPTSIDSNGWHSIDGGTSLASPGVASVAGLYLQKNPTVKYHELWYALTHCDSVDGFTGAVPNYRFGYGKVDAFRALTECSPPAAVQDILQPNSVTILKAYPNPVISSTTIEYDFSGIKNFSNAQIEFYDILGKEVKTVTLKSNAGTVNINKNALSSGLYFYSLIVDGSRIKTEKLDVL